MVDHDDGEQAGTTLPKLSEGVSARCLVDLWKTEYERMRSDGADIKADTIHRTWRRCKNGLQTAGKVGFYDDYAWIIYKPSDTADKGEDKPLSA